VRNLKLNCSCVRRQADSGRATVCVDKLTLTLMRGWCCAVTEFILFQIGESWHPRNDCQISQQFEASARRRYVWDGSAFTAQHRISLLSITWNCDRKIKFVTD